MGRNFYKLWAALLIISGGIAIWFSLFAISGFWAFSRLNSIAKAHISHWEISSLSPSCFAVVAHYTYEIGGHSYNGKTIFENLRFPNQFAADNYLKANTYKNWKKDTEVWYCKNNPTFSSLEREFPQKQCLQALLTVGVFAYFYFSRSLFSKTIS